MILITGATGTVGSEVITALLPAWASHIRVLTRTPVMYRAILGTRGPARPSAS